MLMKYRLDMLNSNMVNSKFHQFEVYLTVVLREVALV